mmetsp:Transcript_31107/g.29949  ORF Transcript_31107/g.29949 Transcript_31107/m.29949 type:complete len:231 (-) Transcript_31107:376-1068(-)|eukprot:CAMPEP_0197832476 /NCGR_PEP_ID=MMETSP1437-20131217/14964_1 /TAXON_ID=49252 ORGANISM="Eucampia antarctica, Strain CCMP1452" /NCGR_SAMPLE_ID=MMETSP1437 /ASSEMBLY_ACC=CAM_ASM_001096 /LENGTH=230 /DNA_ID=CAMNT_0043435873 /DNA_START=96 /DNA_END=788 /DNA_ORIENTATION=+
MMFVRFVAATLLMTLSPQLVVGLSTPNTNRVQNSDALSVNRRAFMLQSVIAGAAVSMLSFANVASAAVSPGGPIQYGKDAEIMFPKAHGTSNAPVQADLLYEVSNKLADKICSFNRHFAENGGYFESTNFEKIVRSNGNNPLTFYDSVTGKPLFVAPINRSADDFIKESKIHGWPSFRDEEVVWDNVRVLSSSGETVALDGTHLGHNLPDRSGNRYCINLVSIAGKPMTI